MSVSFIIYIAVRQEYHAPIRMQSIDINALYFFSCTLYLALGTRERSVETLFYPLRPFRSSFSAKFLGYCVLSGTVLCHITKVRKRKYFVLQCWNRAHNRHISITSLYAWATTVSDICYQKIKINKKSKLWNNTLKNVKNN